LTSNGEFGGAIPGHFHSGEMFEQLLRAAGIIAKLFGSQAVHEEVLVAVAGHLVAGSGNATDQLRIPLG
jgi:hypothetical protein